MPTTPDPTGRPSSAKSAAPVPSSGERSGSTDSHHPQTSAPSDLVLLDGNSAKSQSPESDLAQYLAHPNGPAANSDDSPTVITTSKPGGAPPRLATPATVTLPVMGEPPSIAGRRLGHFELIEAVGAGGMAAVLKARDTELGRVVALKILPPEAAYDPESVTRFKQEARAAAALDHENIARVYFCGEDQGLHFIAFEFVEGINLRQMIDRRGVLPAGECVRYMMQIAAGLNHAAERGVVHRDIKPSNILITPDGRAKIVDMGLARHLGSEVVNGGVTQSGVTLGTFDYISPEQALDPRRADVRSDIYSLGCTFYHALTGRPPVPEGTAARKLRAHQNEEPLDPRELNPLIPDELAAVLGRMMAKDPTARYQTPTELIAHLKGLAERLKIGTDALGNDSATKAVPAERHLLPEAPRIRPWWALAVTAVVVAVTAFIVSTGNPGPAIGIPGANEQTKSKAPDTVIDPKTGPTTKGEPDGPVRTAEQLAKKLEDPKTTKVVLAPGTFDLTQLNHAVAFQGKELELVGAPGGTSRIVLSAHPTRGAAGSLSLRAAESLTVRNVWFDLKLDPDISVDLDGRTQPVGLRLDEAREVHLWDCVFAAARGEKQLYNHEPRAVAITGTTQITMARCLFAPVASDAPESALKSGASAVGMVVPAGAQVSVTDCGFAPHAVAVLVESANGADAPRSEVRFDHSSFMLDPGCAAVETGAPANLVVKASDCVFAPVGGSTARSGSTTSEAVLRGVVIRVRGTSPDGVQLTVPAGRTNAYYSADPLGTREKTYTFNECKDAALAVEDKNRTELKQRPWSELDPALAVGSESPWKAFRLKVGSDPLVFTTDRTPQPLGAVFYNPAEGRLRRAYPDLYVQGIWPPARPLAAGERRELVWFPNPGTEALGPGEFRNLHQLLEEVRPDDVILIRHTGELPRDTIDLKSAIRPGEGEFKVTFRPYRDCAPVFTVASDKDDDQTMFRLVRGEVTFEGIHFRLKPDLPKNEQTVAAVSIVNGRACTFRNCVFTMAEEDAAPVAAVRLPNVEKAAAMMDPAARARPTVVFDRCLIRGRGRGVWVAASRPLQLTMTDTLTAIDGPVLLTAADGKASGSATSEARFTRVTVLAGGPIVEMRGSKTVDAMRAAGLVKLDVEADRCLFVAVEGAGRPLVELDGVEPADVKTVLNWQVKEANWYANFSSSAVLASIRPGGDGNVKEWTRDDWIANVGEPPGADKRFGQVTFATPVTGLKDLVAVKPADVVVKMTDFPEPVGPKGLEVGADPNKLKDLPAVTDEPKPE